MKIFDTRQLETIFAEILLQPVPVGISVTRINTDTRSIQSGDTFVALSGEHFDGHDFVEAAVSAGAKYVISEKVLAVDVPQIVVKNTRLALAALATDIRRDFSKSGSKIIGLTGSVGKTTNKQMLAAIFSQVGKTHATAGNLNNDLGVPFTWFDLPDRTQFAVIEMGANHQGEIAYLSKITRPDVAMITNAGESHLEGFGGLEGVAKGKGELFAQLTAGQVAVINIDDVYAEYWQGLLSSDVLSKTFSLENNQADVYAKDIAADGSRFILCYGDETVAVSLPIVGQHNVLNAVGSAACAIALGVSLVDIAKGLSQFETAKGRLQKHLIDTGIVIDDSYNANPMSMRASADILSTMPGQRLMVLGDMGELGDEALALHKQLGRDLQGKADQFFCLGDKMRAFADSNQDAKHFPSITLLVQALEQKIRQIPQVSVLVKGSRFMKMERVVEHLTAKVDK